MFSQMTQEVFWIVWICFYPKSNFHSSSSALYRHWEASPACSTDLQPPGVRTSVFDFSVLSYNILSQDLLHDNAYLYRHCDPGFLHWDYRLPNLLAEIQNYNADVSWFRSDYVTSHLMNM